MATAGLILKRASKQQIRRTWENAFDEWGKGTMTTDDFYRREKVLASQEFAQRGLTVWTLVPKADPETLDLHAHLESFARRALIKRPGELKADEVTCFSVGTVFCPPEKRGRGYASQLMQALVQELAPSRGVSNLYSDIGPKFYARDGWNVHSPISIRLPLTTTLPAPSSAVRMLGEGDIGEYAARDCTQVEQLMQGLAVSSDSTRVAILPEPSVYAWHFARAQFEAGLVRPDLRLEQFGAALDDGSFVAWTYDVRQSAVVVLRAAVDTADGLMALTNAAIGAGTIAGMKELVFWNPPFESSLLEAGAERIVRDGSLSSLCVFGAAPGDNVEWLLNEKLPWV